MYVSLGLTPLSLEQSEGNWVPWGIWYLCVCTSKTWRCHWTYDDFEWPGCFWPEKDKHNPATPWKTVSPPPLMQYWYLCVWLQEGLDWDSTRSRPLMLKREAFNPEAAQKQATHITTARWSHEKELRSPGERNSWQRTWFIPVNTQERGNSGEGKSCSSPQNYVKYSCCKIGRAGMNLGWKS